MQNNLGSLHQIPLSKYFREEVKQRMGEGPMGSFLVTRGFGGNWGIPQIWQVAISAEMKLLKLSKKTAKMKNSEQENHIIRIIYFFFDKGCVENISKKFYLAPPGGGYWNIWPSSSYYVTFFIRITVDLLGEGNGNPLQYSCLANSMDRRTWRVTVHEITKSDTTGRLCSVQWTSFGLPRWLSSKKFTC